MPRKKANKGTSIDIQRLSEGRLLDKKILNAPKTNTWAQIFGWAILAGIGVGGGIVSYLYFSGKAVQSNVQPAIVVPSGSASSSSQTATTTPSQAAVTPISGKTATSTPATVRQIVVLPTPTGYLNVRSGPGSNFPKIAQLKPGEIHDLISQDPSKTWDQIKIAATASGWVASQYVKLK